MPMPHTRTDSVATAPRVPSHPNLKLRWRFDGERLTCRWIAASAEAASAPVLMERAA
jgi:hypothetical protein